MLIETQRVMPSVMIVQSGRTDRGASCVEMDGLAGSPLADRFCHWRGRSGRRYVFSVYRVDTGHRAGGSVLPRYTEAVVIAVRRDMDGTRRVLAVGDTGNLPELSPLLDWIKPSRDVAADELHFHLLAGSIIQRQTVLRDLAEAAGLSPAS